MLKGPAVKARAKMAAPTASIELNLEHQDLVFYSGERIRGALVVHLSTAVTIAGKSWTTLT